MARLSLDDFEWDEKSFDLWFLESKTHDMQIASIQNFNGWHIRVLHDNSMRKPLHVDTLDAAKALAQMIATPYMEKYHAELPDYFKRPGPKADGPPPFRRGVFKMG